MTEKVVRRVVQAIGAALPHLEGYDEARAACAKLVAQVRALSKPFPDLFAWVIVADTRSGRCRIVQVISCVNSRFTTPTLPVEIDFTGHVLNGKFCVADHALEDGGETEIHFIHTPTRLGLSRFWVEVCTSKTDAKERAQTLLERVKQGAVT